MTTRVSIVGYIGIGMGAVALLVVILHFFAGPLDPPPSLEAAVAEKAVKIRNATLAVLRGTELPVRESEQSVNLDSIIRVSGAALGVVAIVFGVLSFARREDVRVSIGAVALGGGAVTFQFAAMVVMVLLFIILVAVVLSQLGLT